MTSDLKPCPFCGSREVGVIANTETKWVCCEHCGAEGPYRMSSDETEAIAAWNRRTDSRWRKASEFSPTHDREVPIVFKTGYQSIGWWDGEEWNWMNSMGQTLKGGVVLWYDVTEPPEVSDVD